MTSHSLFGTPAIPCKPHICYIPPLYYSDILPVEDKAKPDNAKPGNASTVHTDTVSDLDNATIHNIYKLKTRAQLVQICKDMRIKCSGNKHTLIERILLAEQTVS